MVGSGPGGASVARELARRGKRVVILERGRDYRKTPYYGTYVGALIYADRASLFFTKEGLQIVRPLMVGGATSMYCGSAALPPAWLAERYGVDLAAHGEAIADELGVAPLAPEQRGLASTRIAEAARSLGQTWQPQLKMMRPDRARRFDCGAKCMLGCRCGAKWSAGEWVDDAVSAGAELITSARVTTVIRENGRAAGVLGTAHGRPLEIAAPTVVLSAGGLGTPAILRASGFAEAGHGMAMDTTAIVYGEAGEPGNGGEPPMTWSFTDHERGYMLSTLFDPWLLYPIIAGLARIPYALTWPRWGRYLGVMIKLKDTVGGEILPDGTVTKPMTPADRVRFDHAVDTCRRILVRAGANPGTIFVSPLRGTHPSATVRLGEMVDRDLQTRLPGLYVCDASVFPEALGQPTVLTILSFGRRLAERLAPAAPAAGDALRAG